MYSAHSETLALMLEGLGLHTPIRVPPGSSILFEFF